MLTVLCGGCCSSLAMTPLSLEDTGNREAKGR